MKAIKNSLILTKNGFEKTCLIYDEGKIISIGNEELLSKCDEVIELDIKNRQTMLHGDELRNESMPITPPTTL